MGVGSGSENGDFPSLWKCSNVNRGVGGYINDPLNPKSNQFECLKASELMKRFLDKML